MVTARDALASSPDLADRVRQAASSGYGIDNCDVGPNNRGAASDQRHRSIAVRFLHDSLGEQHPVETDEARRVPRAAH
jgi:hypothetical protein